MKRGLLFLFFVFSLMGFAQTATTALNKKTIKIGEEAILTLTTKVHASDFVVFPEPDSIGKLELIQSYPVDTIKIENQTQLVKKYGLTQFDAGNYSIPSLEVLFNKKKITTNKQKLTVTDVVVDTTKQKMYDIKADATIAAEMEKINNDEITTTQIISAIFGVFTIAFLAYWIIKKIQFRKEAKTEKYVPPFDKFKQDVEAIEGLEKNSKAFYSKLTEMVKTYFNVTLEIPALESTTNEFILWLENKALEQKIQLKTITLANLEKIFQNADLAKFAKINLEESVVLNDKKKVVEAVTEFHALLPTSNEEQRVANALKLVERRKLKQKNIRQFVAVATFLLATLGAVVLLGYQNIADYVHQQWNGKDAHYYQKREWVTSEYGYPPIQIETPEILARIKSDIKSPEIKNYASFEWQTLGDNLSVTLRTIAYKDSVPFVLNDVVNRELGEMMQQNAKGIKMDMKKFKNSKGVVGDLVVGTYTFNDEKGSQNHKFSTLILHDDKNQQIITISHKVSDKEAAGLVDRINNSIEFVLVEDDE